MPPVLLPLPASSNGLPAARWCTGGDDSGRVFTYLPSRNRDGGIGNDSPLLVAGLGGTAMAKVAD